MRLLLDEHYSSAIAEQLRQGGIDAVAIARLWHRAGMKGRVVVFATLRRAVGWCVTRLRPHDAARAERVARAERFARARSVVGKFSSGRTDISVEHDRELDEIYGS